MRKLVVIVGVFVLAMMPAYAQIALNGSVDAALMLAEGDTETYDNPKADVSADISLSLSAFSADETIGSKVTLNVDTTFIAYAWWKPLDQLMIKIGNVNEDSTWNEADIAGWGLHSNDFSVRPEFRGGGGYAGNILPGGYGFYSVGDDIRAQLSLYPVEGLAVNFGFPMAGEIESNYLDYLNAQVVYTLSGIGEAAAGFVNAPEGSAKNIFVQWNMDIGDMKIEFGFNYGLDLDTAEGQWKEPLKFGLGWGLGSENDTMILTARLGASIPMEGKPTSIAYTNNNIATFDPLVGLDFVVNYDLNMFRLYVPVGIGLRLTAEDTFIAWSFNPYIAKDLDGLFFYAGVMLYNGAGDGNSIINKDTENRINWAVPLGIRWDF